MGAGCIALASSGVVVLILSAPSELGAEVLSLHSTLTFSWPISLLPCVNYVKFLMYTPLQPQFPVTTSLQLL